MASHVDSSSDFRTTSQQYDCSSMTKPIANPELPSPPTGKYPAKSHARRVAKWIAENGGPQTGIIYLEGQLTQMTEVGTFTSAP